jgi:hypothetical protein
MKEPDVSVSKGLKKIQQRIYATIWLFRDNRHRDRRHVQSACGILLSMMSGNQRSFTVEEFCDISPTDAAI